MINWPGAFYSDKNPSRINWREVNGHRYYFTINLRESMGLQDRQSYLINFIVNFIAFSRLPIVFNLELFYDDCRLLVTFANSLDQDQVIVLYVCVCVSAWFSAGVCVSVCVCVSVFSCVYAHFLVFTLAQTSLRLQ